MQLYPYKSTTRPTDRENPGNEVAHWVSRHLWFTMQVTPRSRLRTIVQKCCCFLYRLTTTFLHKGRSYSCHVRSTAEPQPTPVANSWLLLVQSYPQFISSVNPRWSTWKQFRVQKRKQGTTSEFLPSDDFLFLSFHFIFNKSHFFSFSFPCLFSLCCQCGVLTTPNPSNMCVGCLRTQVDITEGIPKQSNLNFCKSCERYDTDIFVVIEINLVEQI